MLSYLKSNSVHQVWLFCQTENYLSAEYKHSHWVQALLIIIFGEIKVDMVYVQTGINLYMNVRKKYLPVRMALWMLFVIGHGGSNKIKKKSHSLSKYYEDK